MHGQSGRRDLTREWQCPAPRPGASDANFTRDDILTRHGVGNMESEAVITVANAVGFKIRPVHSRCDMAKEDAAIKYIQSNAKPRPLRIPCPAAHNPMADMIDLPYKRRGFSPWNPRYTPQFHSLIWRHAGVARRQAMFREELLRIP